MNTQRLFNLKGINIWYIVIGAALNVIWTLALSALVTLAFRNQFETGASVVQLLLLVGCFAGPLLIAWLTGTLAADGRGPTYGFYGSLGSVLVLVLFALPSGLLGLMLIVAAISGGLNGGMFSLRKRFNGKP